MITAIIPTRNRPDALSRAVASVRLQTRPPDEFIIVDQSPGDESRIMVESTMSDEAHIRLVYIHDPRISGLVEAKKMATEKAVGDIICFFEDDIILENDYIE
jgi:glycosyltransferase involved in cell wall biosynthesis